MKLFIWLMFVRQIELFGVIFETKISLPFLAFSYLLFSGINIIKRLNTLPKQLGIKI